MSAQPQEQQHRRFNSRTASRSMLPSEVDMVNRYARKYSTTYKAPPYQAVPAYGAKNDAPSVSVGMSASSTPRTMGTMTSINNISHAKRPSNLVSSGNHGLWNEKALASQTQDMESAMESMIVSYQSRLEKQAHFMDEIEREASQNKDFGKKENADNWSNVEVCHWLSTIHLEKYIQNFADQIIDGSILIRDLDDSILVTELGVKRIHVKKIMREIVKLRQICHITNSNSGDKDTLVESLKLEIQSLQRENQHLRDQIKSLHNNANSSPNFQDSTVTSHLSSNTSSMSSLPSSGMNGNHNSHTNNHASSKYGGSSQSARNRIQSTGYTAHNATHNYTVNPRNKKY